MGWSRYAGAKGAITRNKSLWEHVVKGDDCRPSLLVYPESVKRLGAKCDVPDDLLGGYREALTGKTAPRL